LFETGSAFPSTVFIDHDMKVYDMMNNAGSWSIGLRIDAMLENCGSLCEETVEECSWVYTGDINNDQIINIQDILLVVQNILEDDSAEDCIPDVNGDSLVNINDVILILNMILY
jgi:hypothetical protein